MKRLPIKWVRDRAKAAYNKAKTCAICGTTEQLEFHHFYTMTPLFEMWARKKKYKIQSDEDVLAIRDEFITDEHDKIYHQTVTLCKPHHAKLHSIYGKEPNLGTATKQKTWVEKQREAHESKTTNQ